MIRFGLMLRLFNHALLLLLTFCHCYIVAKCVCVCCVSFLWHINTRILQKTHTDNTQTQLFTNMVKIRMFMYVRDNKN